MKRAILAALAAIMFLGLSLNISEAKNNKTVIDVMYFHATIRCQSCLDIERNAKSTMDELYANEIKSGKMTFASLDFLEPENEKFSKKYDFDNQVLIISKKVNGKEVKWKNLDKIWEYSGDYNKFRDYVKKEIEKL